MVKAGDEERLVGVKLAVVPAEVLVKSPGADPMVDPSVMLLLVVAGTVVASVLWSTVDVVVEPS